MNKIWFKIIFFTKKYLIKYHKIISTSLLILAILSYIITAIWIFYYTPNDYLQGNLVKIMYIHVPCAWISIASYILLSISSIYYLVYNDKFCSIISYAILRISLNSSIITLITGAIWGKAAWGTWWIWDPRLTSVFIQVCMLLICYVLSTNSKNNILIQQSISFITIIGLINIPIIKFSVNLWNSIHQNASILTFNSSKIHHTLLYPLLMSCFAMFCFYSWIGMLLLKRQLINLKKSHVIL